MNSSSVDFFIEEEDAASPLPDEERPDNGNNQNESTDTASIGNLFGNSIVQLGLLLVVILVITALIRTRKYQD
jgi:hypothetical protein